MTTLKAFYARYIKPWVKALASAVGGAIFGLLLTWFQGTTPIPTTREELFTVLAAAVLPAIFTVIAPANKITQKQIDKDPNVIGGTVVPTPPSNPPASAPPAPGYGTSWTRR